LESLRQESVIHEIEVAPGSEYPSLSTEPGDFGSSSDLISRLQQVWDRRNVLYRVARWALVLSTIIAFLIPRKYDSTVHIMPPESMSDAGAMVAAMLGKTSPGLMSLAGSVLGMKSNSELFVDLLRSRTVQDHIVYRFELQKVYWERYQEEARKVLDGRTEITADRKTGLITLTVRDRNAERARNMAQAYVEELDRLLAQVSTSSARRQRVFIEQRLISVRNDLEDAEQQFSRFASKNSTLDIKEQAKAMVESAAILQGQLIAAQSELQGLQQIYTESNVRVRTLKARVEELKRQLQKMGGTDASLTESSTPDELYPSIRKLPLLGVEWTDLYRRVKVQETVFELLTQQYELARIQEAKEIPTVNVVDPANLPERKAFPPIPALIAVSTLLAICATVALMLIHLKWQQVQPDDAGKLLTLRIWNDCSIAIHRWSQYPVIQTFLKPWRRVAREL
jgi:capsule polysaccharide export protein KpsE/RkpR